MNSSHLLLRCSYDSEGGDGTSEGEDILMTQPTLLNRRGRTSDHVWRFSATVLFMSIIFHIFFFVIVITNLKLGYRTLVP